VPQVLTTNAVILCPHLGLGTSTPTDPKWLVNGGVVLLENDAGTLACPYLVYPCLGYQLRSMGLNATRIDGRKVVLTTDFNQTLTGLPLTMTETHQVLDNSTPAPIPPGQPAPPLSPAMADTVQPVVTCVPPVLAFNVTTMQPATLSATFTLSAVHPLRWILTLINEPLTTHVDLTNGLPPGATVTPAGGAWDSPLLTVTLTMTAAFMASLTPGLQRFFMTGVSQRGLSGFFEMILTVT
jgi:hypothetical protein